MKASELRELLSNIPDDTEIYVAPMSTAGWISNEVQVQPVTDGCGDTQVVGWLLVSPSNFKEETKH